VSTREPFGANTSRLVALTPTGSSNVALTRDGARARTEPSAGLVETRVACAEAAEAAGAMASTGTATRNIVATR
jgi:hypothetical protein